MESRKYFEPMIMNIKHKRIHKNKTIVKYIYIYVYSILHLTYFNVLHMIKWNILYMNEKKNKNQ